MKALLPNVVFAALVLSVVARSPLESRCGRIAVVGNATKASAARSVARRETDGRVRTAAKNWIRDSVIARDRAPVRPTEHVRASEIAVALAQAQAVRR